jgi:hypothetical protein
VSVSCILQGYTPPEPLDAATLELIAKGPPRAEDRKDEEETDKDT